VFARSDLTMVTHRKPTAQELSSLPETVVVVECRAGGRKWMFALGDSAFTGFVSWLEASAPAA
jgi:hypothetical protein